MDIKVTPTSQPRNRVAKACVVCRQRKIKCDGEPQCKHCKASGKECVYPENTIRRPRSKPISKKNTNTQSMDTLNKRIAKLEQLICNLTEKLVPSNNNTPASRVLNSPEEGEEEEEEEEEDVVLEEEEEQEQDEEVATLTPPSSANSNTSKPPSADPSFPSQSGFILSRGSTTETQSTTGNGSSQTTLKFYSLEHYFGTHCTFHIFSDKSMAWIKAKLRKKDVNAMIPLENLPIVFNICKLSYSEMFIEPPLRLAVEVENSLPSSPQICQELLELFDSIYLVSFLCDVKYTRELLEIHYCNRNIVKTGKGRKLKYSENLIINISLALCAASVINRRIYKYNSTPSSNDSSPTFPTIASLQLDELIQLHEVFVKNSIYYYHKISLLSEGIRTVQAILLLIIFLETSLFTSHVNYALSSLAVRYAQEIGLHRFESFSHLPEEERTFRRRIWWFCQYLDMELCYRNGNPPLVNDTDVSTLTDRDIDSLFKECLDGTKDGANLNLPDEIVADIIDKKHVHTYTGHYLMELTRIRSKSYKELFSATVELVGYNVIASTLKGINEEMKNLSLKMDPSLVPRFYNDPLFSSSLKKFPGLINGKNIDSAYESIITIQLTYFLHLMTINRLPFQLNTPDLVEHQDTMTFRNLSLDSARTVLHICLSLDRKEMPLSFLNWIIFFPMSAFLNILGNCVNYATSPDALKDVSLLIDVSISFFGLFNRYIEADTPVTKIFHQRESVCDLVCRIMLRILVKIMEAKLDINILEENEFLKNHLDAAERDYPELYSNRKEAILKRFIFSFDSGSLSSASSRSNPVPKPLQWPYNNLGYVAISNDVQSTSPRNPGLSASNSTESSHRHPSLSNLLHPTELPAASNSTYLGSDSTFSNEQLFKQGDLLDEDSMNSILFSQLYDLPNFFFDNGI